MTMILILMLKSLRTQNQTLNKDVDSLRHQNEALRLENEELKKVNNMPINDVIHELQEH